MLTKINYQKELDKLIDHLQKEEKVPTLLLHSCCAPCSSYVLEYLSSYFKITVLYYNPNIYPEEEYWKRVREQERFIGLLPAKHKISFLEGNYEKERFYETVKGMEKIPERWIQNIRYSLLQAAMIKKSFMRWQRDWKK